ncbi:MAG: diaminopimelate decarboxylase [Chloroflexota bacterium]
MNKRPFLTHEQALSIMAQYPTPFHIYDAKGIQANMAAFNDAFRWNTGFKNYFAVKATPTPAILRILQAEDSGFDCSSLTELALMEKLGISGEQIMFTSNNTAVVAFKKAREMNVIINLDDLNHLTYLEQHASLPDVISFRYNPGTLKSGNTIIGHPQESKFGITKGQLFEGYRLAKDKGITRFGLHTMVASNELNHAYFVETAVLLFELIAELSSQLGIHFEFVNLGGGLGIPYRPDETAVDLQQVSHGIQQAYRQIIVANGLPDLRLFMECGRFITGPFGLLISKVQHVKQSYKTYIGLDANMNHLMRPALYGAYHHISIFGKEGVKPQDEVDVTGSLCENNDKFAINRLLPHLDVEDIIAIHDTGAHGHAMGFNYNGKLRSGELLLKENGTIVEIRRPETIEDYFGPMKF